MTALIPKVFWKALFLFLLLSFITHAHGDGEDTSSGGTPPAGGDSSADSAFGVSDLVGNLENANEGKPVDTSKPLPVKTDESLAPDETYQPPSSNETPEQPSNPSNGDNGGSGSTPDDNGGKCKNCHGGGVTVIFIPGD
jgi:hypothetical protein